MYQLEGQYAKAKIFASIIEEAAKSQIVDLCNQAWVKGLDIAIMADTHAGKGCTIGTAMKLVDKVCPNLVGVDIGCGMLVVELGKVDIDFERLDKVIHEFIPAGCMIRDEQIVDFDLERLLTPVKDKEYILRSIGTLGGGNHFIEIDEDSEGYKYLVIHSGSRHLGLEVADYWTSQAKEEYSVVSGEDFDGYISDMKVCQEYAQLNRKTIANIVCEQMGWSLANNWETIHNYIDMEHMILRKGAIAAYKDQYCLIPMNMRDGSLICKGKGSEDYLYTAPHGAGRIMSRGAARSKLSLDEFKETMSGIYSSTVCEKTIDEAPMAYKPMEVILEDIKDTVEVVKAIKPVYNFKAAV